MEDLFIKKTKKGVVMRNYEGIEFTEIKAESRIFNLFNYNIAYPFIGSFISYVDDDDEKTYIFECFKSGKIVEIECIGNLSDLIDKCDCNELIAIYIEKIVTVNDLYDIPVIKVLQPA